MQWNRPDSFETQEEYKALFEQAPDAVIAIDEQNQVIFWNPKAEALFGWSVQETMGRSLTELIIPEAYREAHSSGMKRYLSTGEVRVLNRTIEVPAVNRSGTEFMVALTIAQTQLRGRIAFLAFIRDITEQHRNREALEVKTMELERSNRNLEEFAYAASHDLKEPIRKIHVFSTRLKESMEPYLKEQERRFFERIEAAAKRMSSLIDNLLSYSQASHSARAAEVVDLNAIVDIVLKDLDLELEEKRAVVSVGKLFQVRGYLHQLQQVLHNLIGNALKYSKPGIPPRIRICSTVVKGAESGFNLTAEEKQRTYSCLSISDEGIGFDQSDADRIFDVFTRLHGSSEYTGTGIGLSIVHKVIENHKGYIRAEGVAGKGATFHILFPEP